MHYYKRNLGDYAKKAGRLSMLEHGAYTLLMDAIYDREVFPTLEDALDWTWARDEAEVAAVKFVLTKFFELQNDGRYVQKRIQEEIYAWNKRGWFPSLIKGIRPTIDVWKETRLRIFNRDSFTCFYCGQIGGDLECDHYVAVSNGGSNEDSNLVTACKKCNRAKSNKPPEVFIEELCNA